jgi:UDP-N-acetylglucosamine acyltransferase
MSYVHLAHDCQIGDDVTIANASQLAGHVTIHPRATISGLCAVHQFVTIGRLAFVGGASRVSQDVPPYVTAVGNPVTLYGLNTIGLQRAGMAPDVMAALKKAYRFCFNADVPLSQGIARARRELSPGEVVSEFLEFVERTERGVPG